ncbi:hypothetical protein [Streptomyces clavifer]|uniref:hypothetical protein n=1 Tax=Streptomyces clavifer TaxID=68188 RepID=UPI0036804A1D
MQDPQQFGIGHKAPEAVHPVTEQRSDHPVTTQLRAGDPEHVTREHVDRRVVALDRSITRAKDEQQGDAGRDVQM